MNIQTDNLAELEGRQYCVILPKEYTESDRTYPVVYLNGDQQVLTLIKDQEYISKIHYILVIISSKDRLDDFSPWYVPSENKKSHDFGGKGEYYIKWILNVLKPVIDLEYRTRVDSANTAIMGQSVGGLISLFSMCKTDKFGYAACISLSSWFPGFIDYFKEHVIVNSISHIYISTGRKEGADHMDSRKHAVESTEKIYDILVSKFGADRVTIYRDDGKHQDYLLQRFEYAMLWLESILQS